MAIATNLLTGSVGVSGANRTPDVLLVQKLLNAVPPSKGGPLSLLDVDGACGPLTCGGIRQFQQRNLGFADGRIDPGGQTIEALVAVLSTLGVLAQILGSGMGGTGGSLSGPGALPGLEIPGGGDPLGGGPGPDGLTPLRAAIKKWALLGTTGPYGDVTGAAPYGIVSDLDTAMEVLSWGGTRKVRKGWKNLKAIFDETVQGWTENHWKQPGYLDGVKVPGARVPQGPSHPSGVSWCGIFATWCWLKAGKTSKWIAGVGPTGATRIAGNEGIQVGDICVQYGQTVHHFIPVEIDGSDLQGVNGNSDHQSILLKPMKRATINYYYRPE